MFAIRRQQVASRPSLCLGIPAAWGCTRLVSSVFDQPHSAYVRRHIGPCKLQATEMLAAIDQGKYATVDDLVSATIPASICRPADTDAPQPGLAEGDALGALRRMMMKNKQRKSLLGQGYSEALLPPAIQRNVLENPGWYTPYTPYQAEISQGRLEALLNYQTAVAELTGMDLANASLLDEATAAVESVVAALYIQRARRQKDRTKVFVDERCFPATIEMIRSRVDGVLAKVEVGALADFDPMDKGYVCVLVQTPDANGTLHHFRRLFDKCAESGIVSCCGTDLLACTVVTPPGEMKADFVFGNAQRLGIPLGFGGPHPAFFAAKAEHKRMMPGRLVGVSKDAKGRRALRLALQTREQHIKRDSATSNICTAQALLANMASFYCVYHGPDGLRSIAEEVHRKANLFALGVEMVGHRVLGGPGTFFDTVQVQFQNGMSAEAYLEACEERRLNVWKVDDATVSVSLDEATRPEHLQSLLECAGMDGPRLDVIEEMLVARQQKGEPLPAAAEPTKTTSPKKAPVLIPSNMQRRTPFLDHPVFRDYHCESSLMRYIHTLQRKDYGLTHGMIPLGSCTMKLNAAATMLPMSWQRVNAMHPFVPAAQAEGYKLLAVELSDLLKKISGLDAVSLQPNSGAQGEYTGLRVIRSYQASIGESQRNLVLIPANAHGTNPASAVLAGYKPLTVRCDKNGAIDTAHLEQLIEKHAKNIAAAMITYPSTYGIFDANIKQITDAVHGAGGLVYIDGANFNAMVGHTGPGFFGGDVCHYNLHKTFSIPHGGGGPGVGPIAVRAKLAPFLPGGVHDTALRVGGKRSFGMVSGAPLGSASILTISYMLLSMLGTEGMRQCTDFAILTANYLRAELAKDYDIKFTASTPGGLCGHEFILDMAPFAKANVKAEDVAKRLIDYGFHAPTLAFPVNNTLMVEPTESEPKPELDRFIRAMRGIRREIADIESGKQPKDNNLLKNAPHTIDDVSSTTWDRPYTRESAAYPAGADADQGMSYLKFWPTVSRVNNEFGDQHLFCSCGPAESANDEVEKRSSGNKPE